MLAMEELEDDGSTPADAYAAFGQSEGQIAAAIANLRSVLSGPRIQVRCLECVADLPPPARADRGFLAALMDWVS
jgi:protease-4